MGLKSYLANSLRIAIEVSKASVIKKKLSTSHHLLHLGIDSSKNIEGVSKFNKKDQLTEEINLEEGTAIAKVLSKPDGQFNYEVTEKEKVTSVKELIIERSEKKIFETLPQGSIIMRIIIREGLIVEKVYKTPTGSNFTVFF